jgi:endonuclease/exonuclease/phosphatase family metal-dependent hydrolase
MQFRVVTLNLEQDHKRWSDRHPRISAEIAGLRPDVIALNEVCVRCRPRGCCATPQSPRPAFRTSWLSKRVNGLSKVEGKALLTRFVIVETGNLDYQARDIVALVASVVKRPVDFYVTHLYMSRGDDSLRLFQVQQLLQWIDSRADGTPAIVCGDFNATLDASSAGADGRPISPDPDHADGLHPARRSERRGLASLLAADGLLHRLHLDFQRHQDPRQRGLFQSPEPGRSVAVAARPRRCLGRPADMRKCSPNFAWGYGVT